MYSTQRRAANSAAAPSFSSYRYPRSRVANYQHRNLHHPGEPQGLAPVFGNWDHDVTISNSRLESVLPAAPPSTFMPREREQPGSQRQPQPQPEPQHQAQPAAQSEPESLIHLAPLRHTGVGARPLSPTLDPVEALRRLRETSEEYSPKSEPIPAGVGAPSRWGTLQTSPDMVASFAAVEAQEPECRSVDAWGTGHDAASTRNTPDSPPTHALQHDLTWSHYHHSTLLDFCANAPSAGVSVASQAHFQPARRYRPEHGYDWRPHRQRWAGEHQDDRSSTIAPRHRTTGAISPDAHHQCAPPASPATRPPIWPSLVLPFFNPALPTPVPHIASPSSGYMPLPTPLSPREEIPCGYTPDGHPIYCVNKLCEIYGHVKVREANGSGALARIYALWGTYWNRVQRRAKWRAEDLFWPLKSGYETLGAGPGEETQSQSQLESHLQPQPLSQPEAQPQVEMQPPPQSQPEPQASPQHQPHAQNDSQASPQPEEQQQKWQYRADEEEDVQIFFWQRVLERERSYWDRKPALVMPERYRACDLS
ncbi:hypothetical protein BDZ90DRAFT_234073 [Jaminaea rosea]|uniref:Uncharacterized protein n=1 Tax=Jaminaea rosea TaxID=1569628 RepID=A0A316UK87_9BASI|nr:hypothetical protein BDZ90DRAFT_234073 [Jaminaea rosea]PWN25640.1 hypothetical protein BDZ90DRAFT_234073 [Jaminaea rosea]